MAVGYRLVHSTWRMTEITDAHRRGRLIVTSDAVQATPAAPAARLAGGKKQDSAPALSQMQSLSTALCDASARRPGWNPTETLSRLLIARDGLLVGLYVARTSPELVAQAKSEEAAQFGPTVWTDAVAAFRGLTKMRPGASLMFKDASTGRVKDQYLRPYVGFHSVSDLEPDKVARQIHEGVVEDTWFDVSSSVVELHDLSAVLGERQKDAAQADYARLAQEALRFGLAAGEVDSEVADTLWDRRPRVADSFVEAVAFQGLQRRAQAS
jgi:hypothetical protein